MPTVGLNIEHLVHKRYSLTVWDVGGQATRLWKHYFDHVNAIVFVVDSTDEGKALLAREELAKIFSDGALEGVPMLVFYNKQDLKDEVKSEDFLSKELDLPKH